MKNACRGLFFNKDLTDCEKSYILGLIITDGCIRKAGKNSKNICISSKDEYMLKMIMEKVYPEKKLYKDGDNWQAVWANKNDIQYLERLGITERKTYTVRLPDVDNMSHLLRGIFDGDGCVYKSITHDNKYGRFYTYTYVSISSGSHDFLVDIKEFLSKIGIQSYIKKRF